MLQRLLTLRLRNWPLLLALVSAEAVEVPGVVQLVYDGDTLTALVEGKEERVRLLWIDTPEVKANAHGEAMPEGVQARDFVRGLAPQGAPVILWGPGETLERDRYQRFLAVVWVERSGAMGAAGSPAQETTWQENLNLAVVRAGFSPYWRKYGKAPGTMDAAFVATQDEAKTAKTGAWGTVVKWMTDKSNERTARKGDN